MAGMTISYYGHLGLHKALNGPNFSSRPSIIDHSGELQARRRDEEENHTSIDDDGGRILLGKSWFDDYTGEPIPKSNARSNCEGSNASSNHRIIELASLLSNEPLFHTTFVNELICRPITFQNSREVATFLKIEVVKIKWNNEFSRYVVLKPSESLIHNPRRGPLMVEELFTTCFEGSRLTDEFKIKLPSALMDSDSGATCLLVSAYCCRKRTDTHNVAFFSSKFLRTRNGGRADTDHAKLGDEVEFLGCGFLPLSTTDSDVSCLLANGVHRIELKYWAKFSHRVSNYQSNPVNSNAESTASNKNADPQYLILEDLKEYSTLTASISSQHPPKGKLDAGKHSSNEIDSALVVEVSVEFFACVLCTVVVHSHNPALLFLYFRCSFQLSHLFTLRI